MRIEFEKQQRSDTAQLANARNPQQPYQVVTQPALLWKDGEKYPDKFDFRLYFGTDVNKANAVQPMPPGNYRLKESAFGLDNYGGINCDFSELEPILNQQKQSAA